MSLKSEMLMTTEREYPLRLTKQTSSPLTTYNFLPLSESSDAEGRQKQFSDYSFYVAVGLLLKRSPTQIIIRMDNKIYMTWHPKKGQTISCHCLLLVAIGFLGIGLSAQRP